MTRRLALKLLTLCVAAVAGKSHAEKTDSFSKGGPTYFLFNLTDISYIAVEYKGERRRFSRDELWEALHEG